MAGGEERFARPLERVCKTPMAVLIRPVNIYRSFKITRDRWVFTFTPKGPLVINAVSFDDQLNLLFEARLKNTASIPTGGPSC